MTGTQEQIVTWAANLFWRQGYSNTSVEQIIRSAGVSKGSFYHHFSSKDSLGLAVIDAWTEQFSARFVAGVSAAEAPLDKVDAIIDAIVETQQENDFIGCPFGRIALEMGDAHEPFRHRLEEVFSQFRTTISAFLEEAGVDPVKAPNLARFILATIEGAIMLSQVETDREVLASVAGLLKSQLRRQLVGVTA